MKMRISKFAILKELFLFLSANKRYWLIPIVLVLIVLSALILFIQAAAVSPFVYVLF